MNLVTLAAVIAVLTAPRLGAFLDRNITALAAKFVFRVDPAPFLRPVTSFRSVYADAALIGGTGLVSLLILTLVDRGS